MGNMVLSCFLPQALLWYWTVSNFISVIQATVLRFPAVRLWLKLPEVSKPPPTLQSKRGFVEGFRESESTLLVLSRNPPALNVSASYFFIIFTLFAIWFFFQPWRTQNCWLSLKLVSVWMRNLGKIQVADMLPARLPTIRRNLHLLGLKELLLDLLRLRNGRLLENHNCLGPLDAIVVFVSISCFAAVLYISSWDSSVLLFRQ